MKLGSIILGACVVIGALALASRDANTPASRSKPPPTASDAATVQSNPAAYTLDAPPIHAVSTFHGDDCTVDCSGHEAGYQWAEEHDIDDPDNCGGNSSSFIEGCQAYAREQSGESQDEEVEESVDPDD